jgi:hypothetical protein
MSQTYLVPDPAMPIGGAFAKCGELVEVWRRQWVEDDVGASAFHKLLAISPQGSFSLLSVEGESLDENLEVGWRLGPGTRVLERAGLPAIYDCDDATHFEAFLDAVPWEAAVERSMELGILVRGGVLPGQVNRHLNALITTKRLAPL